jgi:hypothetical protein
MTINQNSTRENLQELLYLVNAVKTSESNSSELFRGNLFDKFVYISHGSFSYAVIVLDQERNVELELYGELGE